MRALYTYSAYRRLRSAETEDPGRLRGYQTHLLRRLVQHAYDTVPFYRKRFDAVGVRPGDVRELEDIGRLPVVTKADLQTARDRDLCSSRYLPSELTFEHTSGSTGSPLTLAFDPHYVAMRDAVFLRALAAGGYTVGHKLMLVTASHAKRDKRLMRWRYGSITDPPEQLVAEYNAYRPEFLYGCTTPLRLMAEWAQARGTSLHRPRSIMTTAELLDDNARRVIQEAFGADVFDLYGMTEMGMVGWECSAHAGYHVSDDAVLVEAGSADPVIMTNLHLYGMPMIRFQTGDVAVGVIDEPCACGRKLRRLSRIEGRLVDCVRLADGRTISPYRLTCALENLSGIRRYQVVQEAMDQFVVSIEPVGGKEDVDEEAVRTTVRRALETSVHVRVQFADGPLHEPGRKFRVVECRVPAQSQA